MSTATKVRFWLSEDDGTDRAGFRNLNQAQILFDSLYFHDGLEQDQWLIYYISKPLIGAVEAIKVPAATIHGEKPSIIGGSHPHNGPGKKDVKSFNDLLNHFPMIARQMHQGLQKVFNDFHKDVGKPLPAPGASSERRARRSSTSSVASTSKGSIIRMAKSPSLSVGSYAEDEEDHMRKTLETAVTAAIELFQLVDKQQLSLLGATTELTGPLVERLIEKYVAEQLHDAVLFPRLCHIHLADDHVLESHIHHMINIDVAQVGIEIEGGLDGKRRLLQRLTQGVTHFRKLDVSGSPQEMIELLLATLRIVTSENSSVEAHSLTEKSKAMTVNADALVSLLLVVVIRSNVRHLQARLAYMRYFVFIDDVENGEMGYALSTLEAVLSYLMADPGGLRTASRKNKRLWQATKDGSVSEIKSILEPSSASLSDEDEELFPKLMNGTGVLHSPSHDRLSIATTQVDGLEQNLAHVFPFQSQVLQKPRPTKRVSLDLKSLSGSEYSFHSRTSTVTSHSGIEGDTSIEKLCQTQDMSGDSILMMAVEAKQPGALDYLLSLNFSSTTVVLQDTKPDGTTLLSAAVQSGQGDIINILVDYLFQLDPKQREGYIRKTDDRGRTFAHYLFNAPGLMFRFGRDLPWRAKDKNGQTPLLALCRSYDHPSYGSMVNMALECATDEQDDGEPLHMDNHVDHKGNSLLHAVNDAFLTLRILQKCDADPNFANNKKFTPLMVASKFGRFDLVRTLFLDRRVDVLAKEYRGLTAVELAKDDEVRNQMDDMMLVSNSPAADGRVTAVVRSFFVEDATVRMIIKTAARSGNGMIEVTTCRRSLADFDNLVKWLSVEFPASWLPGLFSFRSPFQIPSKPSRVVLNDIQVRLDKFLKIMLAHSTFSTHELLWEFILAPEIQPEMMAERSLKKADIRAEKVKEEYEPVQDVRDVETFVGHARDSVRSVNHCTRSVLRRINGIRNSTQGAHGRWSSHDS